MARALSGVLSIATVPDSRDARDSIAELVALPFGVAHTLHGIPSGRVHVMAQRAQWIGVEEGWPAPANSKAEVFAAGARATVELSLHAREPGGRALVAILPDGARVEPGSVLVRRDSPAQVRRVELLNGRLRLRPGRHSLLARLVANGRGYVAEAQVTQSEDPKSGTPIVMRLREGASLRVLLRDAHGRPVAGRSLAWNCGMWGTGKGQLAAFTGRSDASGALELHALLPGTRLEHADPGLSIDVPASGKHRSLELVVPARN